MDDYKIEKCVVWDGERALSADEAAACLRAGPRDELHKQAADTIERLQRELDATKRLAAKLADDSEKIERKCTERAEKAERERDEARAELEEERKQHDFTRALGCALENDDG